MRRHNGTSEKLVKPVKNSIKEKQDLRIAEMSALVGALSEQNEKAFEKLSKNEGPDSVRYQLMALLKSKQYEDAAKMIEHRTIDERWCDLGIRALARSGDLLGARMLLARVRELFGADNETVRLRSIWEYASVYFETAFSDRKKKHISPGSLSQSETEAMQVIVSTLSEVEVRLLKDGVIKTMLEALLASLSRKAHLLLGNSGAHRKLAELLLTYSPIPLEVMQDIGTDIIPCPEDVPTRLRVDHPDDNHALLIACEFEADKLDLGHDALVHALELAKKVTTRDEKRAVAEFLSRISRPMDEKARARAMTTVKALLGENSLEYSLIEIESLVANGQTSEALARLEESPDQEDPVWLQIYAHALIGEGKEKEAAKILVAASQKVMHPEILRKAGDLSLRSNEWDQAEDIYKNILKIDPTDLTTLHNLGSLYAQRGNYEMASTFFQQLVRIKPEEKKYRINLALCQKEAGDFKESLCTFNSIAEDAVDLPVILGKAGVLRCLGDTDSAFRNLIEYKDRYWKTPAFVALWLDLAFASGDEVAGHDALKQMISLSKAGKIDENAFRMVHTDEIIEMFKDSARATEERRRHLHTEMLKGRMPWIWAALVSGDAVYWAWRMRTQDLNWHGDDPVNRASFSIYSTNGFSARKDEDGRLALLPLECAPPKSTVVADLSALVTLHRLGLLDKAAKYFESIYVPRAYLQTVLEDGRKMVLHQRSSKETAEKIRQLLSAGSIGTITLADDNINLPTVDEHSESDSHRYRLIDLLNPIYDAGLIDKTAYERIKKVCGKKSITGKDHPSLVQLQKIRIELSTLETITTFGHLDLIAKFYKVQIVETAQKELRDRLNAICSQEEVRSCHFELWEILRSNKVFRFVQHTVPPEMEAGDNFDQNDLLAFFSNFVAKEQSVPLLADDRVCQAFRFDEEKETPLVTFGTDALIRSLLTNSDIDMPSAATAFLAMIRWRYRFIVPPAKLLKALAAQYMENSPGRPLQDIADYVHDCMRDAGLFDGPENTDLKESMAVRLYLSWLNVSAEFLLEIWNDEDFEETTSRKLTDWCVREFLPSLPRSVTGNAKVRTIEFANRLLLSHMLLHANTGVDDERVSSAMKAIQTGLNLSNEEYERIVMEILDDTKR